MRKIISLGLVLSICLGLAGCGNGSKYNLKDAKTCTIEGISFQYPKEWEAPAGEQNYIKKEDGKRIDFVNNEDEFDPCLSVIVTPLYESKDEYLEFDNKYCAGEIQRLKNITVAGQVCYHIEKFYGDDSPGNGEYYYFDSPKGVVIFHAMQNENYLKILPDILKTVTIEE